MLLRLTSALCLSIVAFGQSYKNIREVKSEGSLTTQGATATLLIDDPRPLSKAVDLLETRFGWYISYEDVPYLDDTNVWNVTDPAYAAAHPGAKALIPKTVPLTDVFAINAKTGVPDDPFTALNKLLAAHDNTGNPGKFTVHQANGMFQIVPVATRNRTGMSVSVTPQLDTAVSFPSANRTVKETVDLLCQAIGVPSGVFPANVFLQARVTTGALNEPARDVLLRTLSQATANSGRKMTWQLLCSFDTVQPCYLNFHFVMKEVTDPTGAKRLQYVP